jgi:protein-S-isoprenylcysteine O-methyltransferase Ste14
VGATRGDDLRPLIFSGDAVYEVVFWVTYAIWVASEWAFHFARRSKDRTKARDRGSLNLLMAAIWLGLGMDFALAFLAPQATIRGEPRGAFFAGIGLMVAGMAFRWYSIAVLGKYFTVDVAVHAGQTVVEAGPYRYIRHPAYTGAFLTFVGVGLALGNWMGLAALLICVGTAYGYRMRTEEAALVAALGEPYREYMRRTRRLLPFLF